MKKLTAIFAIAMLSISTTTLFTSCSEDEPDATPAAEEVAGTYTADMTCSVMGSESEFEDMTFTVTATDDYTVSVTIPTFGSGAMTMPELTITGITVSGTDGTYTLDETSYSITSESGTIYSGAAYGTFANNTLTFNFTLTPGAMPMALICSFTAPKN